MVDSFLYWVHLSISICLLITGGPYIGVQITCIYMEVFTSVLCINTAYTTCIYTSLGLLTHMHIITGSTDSCVIIALLEELVIGSGLL